MISTCLSNPKLIHILLGILDTSREVNSEEEEEELVMVSQLLALLCAKLPEPTVWHIQRSSLSYSREVHSIHSGGVVQPLHSHRLSAQEEFREKWQLARQESPSARQANGGKGQVTLKTDLNSIQGSDGMEDKKEMHDPRRGHTTHYQCAMGSSSMSCGGVHASTTIATCLIVSWWSTTSWRRSSNSCWRDAWRSWCWQWYRTELKHGR